MNCLFEKFLVWLAESSFKPIHTIIVSFIFLHTTSVTNFKIVDTNVITVRKIFRFVSLEISRIHLFSVRFSVEYS